MQLHSISKFVFGLILVLVLIAAGGCHRDGSAVAAAKNKPSLSSGGIGPSTASGGPSAVAVANATSVQNQRALGVFAEPSGKLCAIAPNQICIEPTSSSGFLWAQAKPFLIDSKSPSFSYTRFGFLTKIREIRRVTAATRFANAIDIYAKSARQFEVQEKTFVMGKAQVSVDGVTFPYSPKDSLPYETKFGINPGASFAIPNLRTKGSGISFASRETDSPVELVIMNGSGWASALNANPREVALDEDIWRSTFELRTDTVGLSVPADHLIHYSAQFGIEAGNGAPMNSGRSLNLVSGSCPIQFTLNARSGEIVVPAIHCKDDQGTTVSATVKPLYVKGSRITSMLQDELSASASGFSVLNTLDAKITVSGTVFSNRVGGDITGNNAQNILVLFSGAGGVAWLQGERR